MKIGALLSRFVYLCIGTLCGNIFWRSLLHGVAFLRRSCSSVQSPLVSSVCGTHPVEKKKKNIYINYCFVVYIRFICNFVNKLVKCVLQNNHINYIQKIIAT